MKKIIFMFSLILLGLTAFGGKTHAYSESNKTYSVTIRNERYKEGNKWVDSPAYYFDGYVIFERIYIADYKYLDIDYSTTDKDVILLFTNVNRSQNVCMSKTAVLSSEYVMKDPGEFSVDNNTYFYLYFGKKIDDTIPKNSTKTYSVKFSSIYVGGSGEVFDFSINTVCDSITTTTRELVNIWKQDDYFLVDIDEAYGGYSVDYIKNTYSSNYTKAGVYEVIFRVTCGDVYHDFTLTITVEESFVPTVISNDNSGNVKTVVDISSPISLDELKADIKAYDEEDGDLTSKIVFDTNYDDTNLNIGQYYLNAYVVDSDNNEASLNMTIYVVDIMAPTIDDNVISVSYSKCYSVDEILKLIGAKDNYYTDIDYEIVEDNYTSNYSTIGSYAITLKLKDASDNSATYAISVKVVDDVAPVLAKNDISATTANMLSKNEILNYVNVTDISKYSLEVEYQNYKENYNKAGNYIATIKATDVYGNTSSICLNINVVSNNIPIVYYDNQIRIYTDTLMTKDSLIAFLKEATNIDMSYVSNVESTYFDTPDKEGKYEVTLTSIDAYGDESKSVFNILVSKRSEEAKENTDDNSNVETPKKKKGFFSRIGAFFKKIGRWFKNLF